MRKLKKAIAITLFMTLMTQLIPYYIAFAGVLPTTPKPSDPDNTHLFVGLFYHDIWRDSAGNWTSDGAPGDPKPISFPYNFDFPNRKIKKVTIKKFTVNMTDPDGETLYYNSRYKQETWQDRVDNVADTYSVSASGIQGYGTDTVSFSVDMVATLRAPVPLNITKQDMHGLVRGQRYYFPVLITIELEPEGGEALIRHFTTKGKPLNGTPGFTDRTEVLIVGKSHPFPHTPGTADYVYEGHKVSSTGPPSGGNIEQGDPSPLRYDGSFPKYYVYYYYEEKAPSKPDPDPPNASCTPPAPGTKLNGRYMDPEVTAKILADQRGSEMFDVLQGIPTSESLYGNIFARNYLYQNTFVNMTGTCTFDVNVEKTWTLRWDPKKPGPNGPDGKPTEVPDPQEDEEVVTQRYTVVRPYSYWVIDNLEVYKINQGILRNYALPGEQITITPQGYQPPQFTANASGAYYPPSPPDPIVAPAGSYGGSQFTSRPSPPSENLQSVAENGVKKVEVTNDSLVFNGATIMNPARTSETGPRPGNIPAPTQIDENVLYKPNNMISSSKVNRANTTSAGTIFYGLLPGNINGGSDMEFSIHQINTVTVHTPVVNYSSVTDDQEHNQKTNPNYNRAAFILDRPFKVRIPTNGQHVNYPGYGNRDYAKYFRTKQVRFPFDTYNGSRTVFYPKNTWIDIPVNQLDTEFFLPVWVDEGDYTVSFRNIAENAPPDLTYQPDANTDLAHHVAIDEASVEVIGRIYDFHITDIADYNWESVFRWQEGNPEPTGLSYWVGLNGIDGAPRGNVSPFTLPIRRGSHPLQGYKNVAIKTGYHFKFDLKTKGNMCATCFAITEEIQERQGHQA